MINVAPLIIILKLNGREATYSEKIVEIRRLKASFPQALTIF